MKGKLIGFYDTLEILTTIDQKASALGLDRSNYLRMVIREKLKEG